MTSVLKERLQGEIIIEWVNDGIIEWEQDWVKKLLDDWLMKCWIWSLAHLLIQNSLIQSLDLIYETYQDIILLPFYGPTAFFLKILSLILSFGCC